MKCTIFGTALAAQEYRENGTYGPLDESSMQDILNIHNHDISGELLDRLCWEIDEGSRLSHADPVHYNMFAVGDFNYCRGEIFSYDRPTR